MAGAAVVELEVPVTARTRTRVTTIELETEVRAQPRPYLIQRLLPFSQFQLVTRAVAVVELTSGEQQEQPPTAEEMVLLETQMHLQLVSRIQVVVAAALDITTLEVNKLEARVDQDSSYFVSRLHHLPRLSRR